MAGLCRSPRWRLITRASRYQPRRWAADFVVDVASNGGPTSLMASNCSVRSMCLVVCVFDPTLVRCVIPGGRPIQACAVSHRTGRKVSPRAWQWMLLVNTLVGTNTADEQGFAGTIPNSLLVVVSFFSLHRGIAHAYFPGFAS